MILKAIHENGSLESQAEEVLSLSRICELFELKRQTIYSYVSRGLIPYHKKAGKLYFFRQEIKKGLTLTWLYLYLGENRIIFGSHRDLFRISFGSPSETPEQNPKIIWVGSLFDPKESKRSSRSIRGLYS